MQRHGLSVKDDKTLCAASLRQQLTMTFQVLVSGIYFLPKSYLMSLLLTFLLDLECHDCPVILEIL